MQCKSCGDHYKTSFLHTDTNYCPACAGFELDAGYEEPSYDDQVLIDTLVNKSGRTPTGIPDES